MKVLFHYLIVFSILTTCISCGGGYRGRYSDGLYEDDEIQQLKDEIDEKDQRIRVLEEENEMLRDRIENARRRVSDLEDDIMLRQHHSVIESDIDDISSELDED